MLRFLLARHLEGKELIILMLVTTLLTLTVGCSGSQKSVVHYLSYTNSVYGYSLQYPDSWELDDSDPSLPSWVFISGPDEGGLFDGAEFYLHVNELRPDETPEDVANRYIEYLKTSPPFIDDVSMRYEDSNIVLEYSWVWKDKVIYSLSGRYLYTFNLKVANNKSDIRKFSPALDRIYSSFRFP